MSVEISAPVGVASIADRSVMVTGTVVGGTNVGVTIGGVVADTLQSGTDTTYSAIVSLQPGANTIPIVATDIQGNVASRSLTVTRTGATPFAVEATPTSGFVPLSVEFRVAEYSTSPASRIDLDYDGDGIFDQTVLNPEAPILREVATAGATTTVARVYDTSGASFVYVVPIFAHTLEQLDEVSGAVWQGLTTALAAQDATTALRFIAEDAKPNFAHTFGVLSSDMPAIVASFSPLVRTNVSASIAEYAITREVDSVLRVFLIYFVKDGDGVWRIGGM